MTQPIIYEHNDWGFFKIYNKLIEKYPNYPTWLFKEISAIVDHQVELQNNIALDLLNPETYDSAYAFAGRCDYSPAEGSGSILNVTVTLTGAMVKTLPVGYQFGGISSITGKYLMFESTAAASSGGTDTITVPCQQKRTFTNVIIGNFGIIQEYQELQILGYEKIIKSSLSLEINALPWTRVDNFDNSISTDKHFIMNYQSSGRVILLFGDGIYGEMPPSNSTVYATFETTQGTLGVVAIGDLIDNISGDTDIASLTNLAASSGGLDRESIKSIIRNSRANLRTKNIIWTKEDIEVTARAADSSVMKALGEPGLGSAELYIVPAGGGAPLPALKTAVQTYCQARTQFGLMPIFMSDPVYNSQNIEVDITVLNGFVAATVVNLVEFALTIITSAYDNQVTEYYQSNGIALTRTNIINTLWAWAFNASDEEALAYIIEKWITIIDENEYRRFGQDLEVGDIWIMGNSLYTYGVDLFDVVSPLVNQAIPASEICSTGTITVNDVT